MVRTPGCGVQSAQRADATYFPAIADTARAKPLGKRFVLQWKFPATHSGPIFVGGVKQFSVASTVVEAHLRNKSPIFVLFLSILQQAFSVIL